MAVAVSSQARLLRLATAGVLGVAACSGVASIAAVVLLLLAAASLGNIVFRRLGDDPDESGILFAALSTTVGLALLAWVVSISAIFEVNYPVVYATVLAGAIIVDRGSMVASLYRMGRTAMRDWTRLELLLAAMLGNMIALCVAVALLPEVGLDALGLHLAVIARLHDAGAWHFDVARHLYAVVPMDGDYIYAIAYMLGGETSARLANVACWGLALALVYGCVRTMASRSIALGSALVAAVSPLAALESATLFIENAWTMLLLAALVSALMYVRDRQRIYAFAVAVALGGALACKMSTLAFVPLVVLVLYRSLRESDWRVVAQAATLAIAIALPPYFVAWLKTGNPVFPFFNAIFGSSLYSLNNYANRAFPPTLNPLALYDFTFQSDRYLEAQAGAFGFTTFLLLPALCWIVLTGRQRELRLTCVGLLLFVVITVAGTAYLRYLYPVIFVVPLLGGMALAQASEVQAPTRTGMIALAMLSVLLNVPFLAAGFAPLRDLPLAATVQGAARDNFLHGWAPVRRVESVLNGDRERAGRLALLGTPYIAGLDGDPLTASGYHRAFFFAYNDAHSAADFARLFTRFEVDTFVTDPTVSAAVRPALAAIGTPRYFDDVVTVYRLNDDVRFPVELLVDTTPRTGRAGWSYAGAPDASPLEDGVRVSADNVYYAVVPVSPERYYRLAIEARCDDAPAAARLQVVWLDDQQRQLSASVAVRECSPSYAAIVRVVKAPPSASLGVVYATGNEKRPIVVRNVSLRARPIPAAPAQ